MKKLHKLNFTNYSFSRYNKYEIYLVNNGWQLLDEGSARRTYRRGKMVIKIPMNLSKDRSGIHGNILEAYAYRKYRNRCDKNGFFFAPCRLLSNGCLMMPFVDRKNFPERQNIPAWVHNIDGWQCAYYKGRMVAYDSEYNIQHLLKAALKWAYRK